MIVEHFKKITGNFLCDDGQIRFGEITNIPFIGNEINEVCTLNVNDELFAVEFSELLKVLGYDPRKF